MSTQRPASAAEERAGHDDRSGPRPGCRGRGSGRGWRAGSAIAVSGPGCGGMRPCIADRPASAGMPDGDQRDLGAAGHQVDDRHQQHQADLEEHRQADDRADQGHRPRQRPPRGLARRSCRRSGRRRRSRRAAWRTSRRARSGCRRRPRCRRTRRGRTAARRCRRRSLQMFCPATAPTVSAPRVSDRNGCSLQQRDQHDDERDAEQRSKHQLASRARPALTRSVPASGSRADRGHQFSFLVAPGVVAPAACWSTYCWTMRRRTGRRR